MANDETFEGTCPSCGQTDHSKSATLSPKETALVYNSETREFGLLMPEHKGDDTMDPQQVLLVACLFRLNEDQDWLIEMMDYFENIQKKMAGNNIILPH